MSVTERLTSREIMSLWTPLWENKEIAYTQEPIIQNLVKLAVKYEGLLSFKVSKGKWLYNKDLFIHYLKCGFPDVETLPPVMTLEAGLRYLHLSGMPRSFKLSRLKEILADRKWLIKTGKHILQARVTRGHLNKLLEEWNGKER